MDRSAHHNGSDEINLIDLWLVMVRHKKVIIITFLTICLAGIGLILASPKKYSYKTTIEVGASLGPNGYQSVEDPDIVLSKINQSYIPYVLQKWDANGALPVSNPKFTAVKSSRTETNGSNKDSNVIVIEAKGPAAYKDFYLSIERAVLDSIVEDQKPLIKVIRNDFHASILRAQNTLSSLQDQRRLIEFEIKRADEKEKLIKQQIAQSNKLLSTAEANNQKATLNVKGAASAMTLLMLNNYVQQQRQHLASLEQQLYVDIPNERDKLVQQLSENKRKQANTEANIQVLEAKQGGLRETHAIVPPMRSLYPIGRGRVSMVLLTMMVALFVSLFVGFIAEFLANVQRAREALDTASESLPVPEYSASDDDAWKSGQGAPLLKTGTA